MKTMSLIGAGKVGQPLATLWQQSKQIKIQQIITQSHQSTQKSIEAIGAGKFCATISKLQPVDIIFIAVPDTMIAIVCKQLAVLDWIQPTTFIFHTSGCVPAHILEQLTTCYAQIHPALSFANSNYVAANFAGTICTVQGSADGISYATMLCNLLGAKPTFPTNFQPALYHVGLVFVSNYLLSLLAKGAECLHVAGIPKAVVNDMVIKLAESVFVQTSDAQNWGDALTGPISRGDVSTLVDHIHSLSSLMPDLLSLYRELGLQTMKLAQQQGLDRDKLMSIRQHLEEIS